jgi:ComF family protein
VRSVAALGVFAGPLRRAVHRLKYAHEFVLAEALGAELGDALAVGLARGWRVDSVVPVPLAPARARERGHDQADRLAAACAATSGVTFRRALRRVRDTRSQVGLGRDERRANVRGAFVAEPLDGGVALVDDVLTTGSTLAECARVLKRAGAREVRALVVAVER